MRIMLDKSPQYIAQASDHFDFDFWQLRTPLSRNRIGEKPYGLDNGCFKRFERKTWERMLVEAEEARPVFVCLPDLVGDARRTLDMFDVFKRHTNGLPRALVLQDGIGNFAIPWDDLSAVFVGGSDKFKISQEAINACKAAKMLGKWVHVGRVNESSRVRNWIGIADSIDGSGISRFYHMLKAIVSTLKSDGNKQEKLDL